MKGGKDIFAKTIYAEARGEPRKGQQAVGHVIKNRAEENRSYWGGNRIEDVCRMPGQFECWNGLADITIRDRNAYESIRFWSDALYDARPSNRIDITDGSDHYNNPDKEGYPAWTRNCTRTMKIGNHQFYRSN